MLAGTDRFSLVTLRDSTDSRRKKQEEEEGVMQLWFIEIWDIR